MSLFAEFFALPSGISSLSQIDFDAEPTATDTVDQLDTMHSTDPFWAGGRTDDFAARYTGNLNVNKGGTYTFYLTSDDGSALYIDGTRVIGNDGLHWTIEERATIELSAGSHDIEVRYFEQGGAQSLALDWQGPDSDGSRVTLSGSSISHGGVDNDDHDDGDHDDGGHDDGGHDDGGSNAMAGLRASYFALTSAVSSLNQIDFDATPTATGMVDRLDTIRSFDAFWEGGVTDDFAALYTGNLNVEEGGTYTFYLSSDDGSALYIDGELVLGNDGLHATREESVTIDLSAGAHEIEVRYFERGGAQTLALDWQGPDSDGARVTISGDSFSHGGHDDGHDDGGHDDHDDDDDHDDGGHDDGGHDDGHDDDHDDGDHDDGGSHAMSGLRASYFALSSPVSSLNQIDFDATPTATGMVDRLDIMRSFDAFWDGGVTDDFAARYTGNLNVEQGGRYTFYLSSDDGSALYIDGERVIGNDGLHGTREESVTLNLSAGAHDIEIVYFERGGAQTIALDWQGPDSNGTRETISGDSFSHMAHDDGGHDDGGHDDGGHDDGGHDDGGHDDGDHDDGDHDDGGSHGMAGLRASYFALASAVSSLNQIDFDATPTATGMVDRLDTMRSFDAFWDGGVTDDFAARYTGDLNVEQGGTYTFYLSSDDGSALYIDGEMVIGNDGLHGTQEESVTIDLSAGAHDIEVLYFERGGAQTLALEWEGPDSNGARETVSGDSFSHTAHDDGGHDDGGHDDGGHDDGGHDDGGHDDGGHDDGGHDDGGHDDGDHGDHGGGGITPPSTPAEIEAFVAAVRAQTDEHAHHGNEGMAQEHMQVLDLVPHAAVTHIAINNGDWFDPGTWYQGQIPGEGAQAIIPEGLSVTYDGESDASLFTVRVDGELSFATHTDTRMVLDTMVVSPTGRLEIGTEANPIADGVNAEIVIANNGNINTSWDPQLFSRGVISHGEVEIHGAEKTSFLKVDDAPMAGDTTITLAEVPEGWQVGDTLIVSGTHKQGWVWDNDERRVIHRESEDEEVVITGINGSTVTIDRPLEHDHDTPRADLSAYVANMSRNITFSSEDGEDTALHHRGHVMFMHSDDVDVRYAAFDDLGRTDKSEPAFDVGELGFVASDSNIKSRYPFHLHKTGTEAQEDPAIAIGNTVSGSPGWGFVHHQSHATFTDNVAFDVFGAAFAAEDGNETGIWSHNMAIRSEGIGWGDFMAKDAGDVARHDNGRTGDGFFFAGRLVEASDNVAVNTTHGFVWMHRSAPIPPLSHTMDQPEIAYGANTVPVDHAVIQGFQDNEAFGTQIGLIVIKGSAEQWHDVRSVFDGFLNWETSNGVDISYTSHYTLIDFEVIATTSEIPFMDAATGYKLATNTFDFVLNDVSAHGFETGVDLEQTFTFEVSDEDVAHALIDVVTSDVENAYVGLNPSRHAVLSSDQLVDGRLEFEMTGATTIAVGETLYLDGTKTDSIGSRNRQFSGDTQRLEFHERIAPLIVNEGYYKTEDGRNVILVEDFVADRATGELHKFAHVVTLDMTDDEIRNSWSVDHWGGARFNGPIVFDDVAPETRDDQAMTPPRQDVLIDVLANDSHAAGAPLRVDGLSTTPNGNVYVQDDNRLLYRPNPDFVGTDTFHYWAADNDGQFTRATVTVEVSENQI